MTVQTFVLNGSQHHRRRPRRRAGPVGAARPARRDRPQVRLRHQRLQGLHVAHQRQGLQPLLGAGRRPGARRRGDHDRGPARHRRRGPAPDAAGLARPRRAAVRLLPARPDHGRRGAGRQGTPGGPQRSPSRTSTASATSAAAAPTPASARPSSRASAPCESGPARRVGADVATGSAQSGGAHLRRLGSGGGEEDAEGAALAERGVDLDPAAVPLDDPLHDRQPEAGAGLGDRLGVGGAEELREQLAPGPPPRCRCPRRGR